LVVLVVLVVMMLVVPCAGQGIEPLPTRSLVATAGVSGATPTGVDALASWFERHELRFCAVKSARTLESLGTGASLELKRLSEDHALWLDLCAQFEAGEKPRGFGGLSTEIDGLPVPLLEKLLKPVQTLTFGVFDCVGIGTDGRGVQAYLSTKF
jgi:hypothetical protein